MDVLRQTRADDMHIAFGSNGNSSTTPIGEHDPEQRRARSEVSRQLSMQLSPAPPVRADAPGPRTLAELYWAFTVLALQGFGGVLAVVQRELVEKKRWLTAEEFVEDWAVAQIMPGPNVVNLSVMLGDRYFGWRGALTGLAGMLSMPLVIVILIAAFLENAADTAAGQGALRGMGAVAAGLIAATALKLMPALRSNPMGQRQALSILALTFVLIALARVPLAWVLLGVGTPACGLAWVRLKRQDTHGAASASPKDAAS